jgi:hypothetical protein
MIIGRDGKHASQNRVSIFCAECCAAAAQEVVAAGEGIDEFSDLQFCAWR